MLSVIPAADKTGGGQCDSQAALLRLQLEMSEVNNTQLDDQGWKGVI